MHDTGTPGLLDDTEITHVLMDVTTASAALARVATVPVEVRDLVRELPQRLHADAPADAWVGDPYLSESAYAGAARAAAALLDSDAGVARGTVRIALEQVRQALRDILEGGFVAEDVPAGEVARRLERMLGLPQQDVAALVGVSVRTWQRWITDGQPDGPQLARLRRVACVASHLRHTLTGPGVARWFSRPHPLVKDGAGAPADLLDSPEGYRQVLALAAALRSGQAS